MEWLSAEARWISEWIEAILWAATWLAILAGLTYEGGRRGMTRATRVLGGLLVRTTGRPRGNSLRVPVAVVAVALVFPSLAVAGQQGWWWGSPINPGFDRSTVIRVSGTVLRVSFDARSGPAMLTLECPRDTYTVMLGPGSYLAQHRPDIQAGDPLTVEGSKMMDHRGNLHLVAARVTNQRTGAVLELRDDVGRPLWMVGPRHEPMVR